MAAGSRRRLPRGILLRFLLLVAIVAVGLIALQSSTIGERLTREQILETLEMLRQSWWSPLLLVGLLVLVSLAGLPVSPLVAAGGAVFGMAWGSLLNGLGLFLGAGASYGLALWLGRDFIEHIAGKKLRRAERLFERRGFWPLIQVRFMPLPFAVVNYGAPMAGVRPPLFFLTTLLGLAPATSLHTLFAAAIVWAPEGGRGSLVVAYLGTWALLAFLTGVPSIRLALRRRERYRELRAERLRREV